MSRSTRDIDARLPLRGWRNRETGVMHLFDCFDFDRLDATAIEDVLWWPGEGSDSLCPWCFAGLGDDAWPRVDARSA
jgi:hypothetical protein